MKTLKKRQHQPKSVPKIQKSTQGATSTKKEFSLDFSLSIVHETSQFVVINKPALVDSQNSKPGRPSVVDFLKKRYKFSGLVHRLDFGTSGLMVCAKNAEGASYLTELLKSGKIKRSYQAVVLGLLDQKIGILNQKIETQSAVTHFKVLKEFKNASLIHVELETGRKHQIRIHFAQIKHPLLGDHLHGNQATKLLFHRPALHSFELKILDQKFTIPMAQDLIDLMKKLDSA